MSNEVIVFPDAVELTIDYLRTELTARSETAVVHVRVPNPRPAELVRVRRTGGTTTNLVVDGATLTVETWAATEHRAMELAQLVRALLHALAGTTAGGIPIYRVSEFAGPALLPDPDSDQPRVTQTMQVHTRGTAA